MPCLHPQAPDAALCSSPSVSLWPPRDECLVRQVQMLKPDAQCDGVRRWGSEVVRWRALTGGIIAPTTGTPEAPSPLPPCDDTRRSRSSASCLRSLARTQPLWGHDRGLLASRNVRIKFQWFVSCPVCGILVTAAQMDYESEERKSKHMLFCSTTKKIKV